MEDFGWQEYPACDECFRILWPNEISECGCDENCMEFEVVRIV